MTEIIAFLHARLREDEQLAKETMERQPLDQWDAVGAGDEDDTALTYWSVTRIAHADPTPAAKSITRHIAHWDPARVLAEVEAKRRIIALHLPLQRGKWPQSDCHPDHCSVCVEATSDYNPSVTVWPCPTLRALILPYTDHPDYDPAWTLNTV